MRIKTLSVLGLMCGLTAPAVSLAEVELSGYLTFATTYASTDNTGDITYYNALANTDHWDFDTRMNHVGVQIYSALTDKVSVTLALTAQGGQSGYEVGSHRSETGESAEADLVWQGRRLFSYFSRHQQRH